MEKINYPIRINRYLALNNYCSRREADNLIAKKIVKINGQLAKIGDKVNEGDKVEVDVVSPQKAIVRVPDYAIGAIIGKQGKHIEEIEQDLGIGIEIEEMQGFNKKDKKRRR